MLDTFVALDFETTGTNTKSDRVVEIGAVKVIDGVIVDRFETLVSIEKSAWSWHAEKIHGIRHHQTINAPSPASAFKSLIDFIGFSTIVAHNANFEKQLLESELNRLGLVVPVSFECSCTSAKNKLSKQQVSNHRLSTIADYFSIVPEGPLHRALPDALLCAKVWLELEKTRTSSIPMQIKKPSAFSDTPVSHVVRSSLAHSDMATANEALSKSKAVSQLNLKAWQFEHGDGVEMDMQTAIMLYREAAALGSAYAIFKLGEFYRHGEWLAKDLNLAQHWFETGLKQHPREPIFNSRLSDLTGCSSGGHVFNSILASAAKAQVHIAKAI